jgi:arylsulfatase A-like enzyme
MFRSHRTPAATGATTILLLPGAIWGAAVFLAFALIVEPRPRRASEVAILLLLAACDGLVHSGTFAAAAILATRAGRLALTSCCLLAGGLYAILGLSIVKFSVTRSHLRFEDLWFLATSARQAAGEGTGTERTWLLAAVVSPLVLAALFWALVAAARRGGTALTVRAALALAGVGLDGFAASVVVHPAARHSAAILFPDSSAVARGVTRWLEPSPHWRPDPALSARLAAPARAGANPERWNVVVLMLESVPWIRFQGPEARPETTPRLLDLARESTVFERAYASSTHSDYAQTSILASLYPRKGDSHDYFLGLDYPRSLPWDVLGPHGWRTGVLSTQNESWGNMISFLRTPRLETLRHAPDFEGAPRRGEGSQTKVFEETVVDAFLSWAGSEPHRPFVAYVNFQATHYPYVWPETFAPPFGPAVIDFPATFVSYPRERAPVMIDRFHNALAYVDREVGRLIDGLRATDRWGSTALLVVADHGESFYEQGAPTHGNALVERQVRVPMMLRVPGRPPRVVESPVSVLDALPTLYRVMGLPRDAAHQGRDDVLDAGYDGFRRPILYSIQGMTREDGILLGRWKRLVNHDGRAPVLFDLALDPYERTNLAPTRPAEARALEQELARRLEPQLGYYRARGWRAGWGPPRLP